MPVQYVSYHYEHHCRLIIGEDIITPHIQGVKPVQLSTIDYQIERIAALLTKYNYTDDEKAIKLSYLRGYVAACLDASVISANEYKAFVLQIESL